MSRPVKISQENTGRYIQLGLTIAHYRKIAGITQESLAAKSSLSRTYISSIEAPNIIKTVSLEALFNIADALEVPPERLLGQPSDL